MDLRYVPRSVQESMHGAAPQLKELAKKVFRSDTQKMESFQRVLQARAVKDRVE